jgi:prephenate dehydrogenase
LINQVSPGELTIGGRHDVATIPRIVVPVCEAMVNIVIADHPQLYAEIICNNKMMTGILPIYEQILATMKSFVLQGDAEGLTKVLQQEADHRWP